MFILYKYSFYYYYIIILLSIIQCYAPKSAASDEGMEQFDNSLQDTLDSVPNRDVKIIMGDFNAKVGKLNNSKPNCVKFVLGDQNERGADLLEFWQSNNLIIANTLFDHHPRHLYTWISLDSKTRNQIDYIMINQKWIRALKNAKTRPGADCNTDHQLFVVDMQVRLKKLRKVISPVRLDYTSFTNQYSVKIYNSFEPLLEHDEEKSPNEIWKEGKDTILRVTKSICPKNHRTQNRWISKETQEEAEKRRKLRAKGTKTEFERTLYTVQNATVKKLMGKIKKDLLMTNTDTLKRNPSQTL